MKRHFILLAGYTITTAVLVAPAVAGAAAATAVNVALMGAP